jgi:AcrR family transcriptional regulator
MSRAEQTRQRILQATRLLLESRPGAPVSMAEIAEAAGVTRQLLYFHFENRTALLVELSRILDAEARTPQLQATIDDAPDGRAALRAAVRVQAAIKPKIHGLASSLELLRPTDEAAAAACDEREAARLGRCRAVIDRLFADGSLSSDWSRPAAAELLWSMTSLRSWEDLVKRRGWSSATWTKRTTAALEATLLEAASYPPTRIPVVGDDSPR